MIPSNEQVVAYVRLQGAASVAMVRRRFQLARETAVSALQLAEQAGLVVKARESNFYSMTEPPRRKGREKTGATA